MSTEQRVMVRAIEKQDVEAAQQFLLRNLKDLYDIDDDYPNNKDIWAMEEVYLETASNTILGAFDETGKIVGTIAVRPYDDRIKVVKGRYLGSFTADLGRCYIEKSLRRKGIGSLLVQEIFRFCQETGYQMIYLHTHKFLPGGFQFWQKQGFEITVEEAEDETVHMEKKL